MREMRGKGINKWKEKKGKRKKRRIISGRGKKKYLYKEVEDLEWKM